MAGPRTNSVGGQGSPPKGLISQSWAKETNYIGALEIDYHWVMKQGFQLYSGAGVGVRIRKGTYNDLDSTETVSKALPTFHVNLLGFRIGRKIGIFGEGGFGYKGMFCGGLNAQF